MKLGVSSYSFSQAVAAGTLQFNDIPSKATAMGFDVVELTSFKPPAGETALSFAPKLRELCDRAGITVSNYTVGADFLRGSSGDWKAEAERLKEDLRVAKTLGAPGMRHDATSGYPPAHKGPRGFDDALPLLAKGCRAVTEFAADLGIRTMVENHGFFAQDSARLERLMNAVNHPNFGWLVDMGNFLCVDEDPAQALGRAMPYAFYVHAKDFHVKSGRTTPPGAGWFQSRGGNYLRGAIIGHGEVPILQCLGIMKKAGYDGVLSIEFEGIEEPLKGIALGLANLRRFVQMLG
jgi:sugar phosphate isomerase/epimerase